MQIKQNKNALLIQGDCLEIMPMLPILYGRQFDMILTDLPYGEVNRNHEFNRKSKGLRNLDKGKADELNMNINELIPQCIKLLTGSIYIFCGVTQISEITKNFINSNLSTRLGVWNKTNPSPMNGTRLWLSGLEFCVFGRNPKSTFNEHCKKALWDNSSIRSKNHPTQKPIKLFQRLIEASSQLGDVVFDPFMGSGTTGVACMNTDRKFVGIELDPEYFKIACERVGVK